MTEMGAVVDKLPSVAFLLSCCSFGSGQFSFNVNSMLNKYINKYICIHKRCILFYESKMKTLSCTQVTQTMHSHQYKTSRIESLELSYSLRSLVSVYSPCHPLLSLHVPQLASCTLDHNLFCVLALEDRKSTRLNSSHL